MRFSLNWPSLHRLLPAAALLILAVILLPEPAQASDSLDSGDTAWMLTSTALVLMMTLPCFKYQIHYSLATVEVLY